MIVTTVWTCPECGEVHVFPKSGPFSKCCLMNSLAEVTHGAVELIAEPDPADWWKS